MTRRPGFTLLETLVALAVVALGLGALLSLLSGGLRLADGASGLAEAAMVAQSRLAALDGAGDWRPGETAGEEAGYAWTVTAAPADEGLLRVELWVRRHGKAVGLVTLRPAAAE